MQVKCFPKVVVGELKHNGHIGVTKSTYNTVFVSYKHRPTCVTLYLDLN